MSFSRPIQWYHSPSDPIWPDGTFKEECNLPIFYISNGATKYILHLFSITLFRELSELSRILLYLSQGNIPELDTFRTGEIPDYFLSLSSSKICKSVHSVSFEFRKLWKVLCCHLRNR